MLRSGYKDTRDYEHYKRLAECYLAVNNSSQAYEYLTQAYALRDSAFHTEQTEQLSEYSVKYQTKEKELEIVTLRQEQLEQETYMLRHRIIVGSVISLLGILLLGSLYARQRQRARIAVLANAANEDAHSKRAGGGEALLIRRCLVVDNDPILLQPLRDLRTHAIAHRHKNLVGFRVSNFRVSQHVQSLLF